MKRVYFEIKANSTGYWHYIDVMTNAAKDACAAVKAQVFKESGRNAFTPFCCPRNPKDYQVRIMDNATPWDAARGF